MSDNIVVCFSYNAPPLNDPEAFCTARLLSALANNGYFVHLVTINHPQQIEPSTTEELLDNKIKITRIEFDSTLNNFFSRIHYLHFYKTGNQISYVVQKVKKVLQMYDRPILLTRALPIISNVVGFYTKEFASIWVAHFSDPFPIMGAYSRRTYYKKLFDFLWTRKVLRKADRVTVTCFEAKKYFTSQFGEKFKHKMSVLYHIGFPPLKYEVSNLNWRKTYFNLVHVGFLTNKRYVDEIFTEFKKVSLMWHQFRLIQYGRIDIQASKLANEGQEWLTLESGNHTSPNVSSYILSQADMNLIIDTRENISYSPYLPSKFAYAVAANKPILAVGIKNSEMYNLSLKFPSINFVDISEPNALSSFLLKIKEKKVNLLLPEDELMKLFEPSKIADDFSNIFK